MKKLLTFITFAAMALPAFAQVSGIVFRDFNANGTKDNAGTFNEPFVQGITVKVYNTANAEVGSTTTDASGAYSFTALALPLRIEFVLPPYYYATKGNVANTTVQFMTAAGVASLAVNSPDDYWDNINQPTPKLLIPKYSNGAYTGPSSSFDALYTVGNDQNSMTPTKTTIATLSQIGAVNGVARDKQKNRFFLSSFLKRHVGFGPKGIGGVYIVDSSGGSYTVAGGFDLQGVVPSNTATPIDLGAVTRVTTPTSADNYIANGSSAGEPNRDLDAFAKVGTIGFGDTDMDDAKQRLFLINTNQNTIITVDVSGASSALVNASAATLQPLVKSYSITLPAGVTIAGGNLRCWGLKIYNGRGYVGAVADAMTSQNNADFKAYIFSFDINNIAAGFTKELEFGIYTNYHPWVSTYAQTGLSTNPGTTAISWRQIMVGDIEFDEEGNMIVGVTNRFGHQMGYFNYTPVTGNTNLAYAKAYGDIIKVCKSGGGWSLGAVGSATCPMPAAGNTSEFYNQDHPGDGGDESSNGYMAKLMGSNKIVNVVADPFPGAGPVNDAQYYTTGGINWYSTTDGSKSQAVRVFGITGNGENFGKAIGLGDIEFNLNPQPLEIGNRVWADDGNGIQDAGEAGIGATIDLFQGATQVGTTTSNATTGNWYFNDANVIMGGATGLLPNTAYTIRIATANIPTGKSLTAANVGGAGQPDVRDSDASMVSGNVEIAYTTGGAGQNDHTLDMGFMTPLCSITATKANDLTCATPTALLTANSIPSTGVTYSWSNSANTQTTTVNAANTYTVTVTETATGCTATANVTVANNIVVPACVPITVTKTK